MTYLLFEAAQPGHISWY